MPWYTKYTEALEWQQFFKVEAERKLGKVISDWENCMAEAVTRLWVKLSALSQPRPDAFVATAYRNILEDIRREQCGRPRLPVAVKAEGPPVTDIYKMYCLQQYNTTEIAQQLNLPRSQVAEWTGWFLNKNKCPKRLKIVSSYTSANDGEREGGEIDFPDPSGPNPVEADYSDDEQLSPLQMLLQRVAEATGSDEDFMTDDSSDMSSWAKTLELSDHEALILRLRFIDGQSTRQIAAELNTTPSKLQNQEAQLFKRLRGHLE